MFKWIASKVSSAVPKVVNAVKGAAKKVASAVKKVVSAVPKMINAMKNLLFKFENKLNKFLDTLDPDLQELLCGIERGKLGDEAITFLSRWQFRLLDYGLTKLNKGIDSVPWLNTVANAPGEAWKWVTDKTSEGMKDFGRMVNDAEIPFVSDFVGSFTGVSEGNGSFASVYGALGRGIWVKGVGGTVDGVMTIVTNPLESVQGLSHVIANVDEVAPKIVDQVGDYVDKNLINGTAESRAEFAGQVVFEVATAVATCGGGTAAKAGVKGADTAVDIARATDKATDIARATDKASDVARAADKAGDAAKAADKAGDVAKAADKASDAARTADKAGDAAKAADKASDVAKTADKASDAAKTADKASDVARAADKASDAAKTADKAGDTAKVGESGVKIKGPVEEVEVKKVPKKTGVGVTGEGIPKEEVPSRVWSQIHEDSKAAYGYSPNEGTTYSKYDFTDIEKAKANRVIREEYIERSKVIQKEIDNMTAKGASKEEIAHKVVDMRNEDKVAARSKMDPKELAPIEERNMELYGNKIGPTAEDLFEMKKEKLVDIKTDITDEEIWDAIIKSSMKKDDVINTLLGVKH